MEANSLSIRLVYLTIAATFVIHCDARRSMGLIRNSKHQMSSMLKHPKKLKIVKHTFFEQMMTHLNLAQPLDSTNTQPYGVSSPFTLPPYESLPPIPLPENAPPFCGYPPSTPQSPSTTNPTPTGYGTTPPSSYFPPTLPVQSPPQSPIGIVPSPPESSPDLNPPVTIPSPPESVPSPLIYIPSPPESPFIYIPSPPGPILSPPYYEPSPPNSIPNSPYGVPSPTGFVPSPPIFLPPIVFPPPTTPPSPKVAPRTALWCVAKASVPDPIIQEAMNYACGSGADCDSIQPSGPCFEPNTLFAHASYAFNSYWQRTKVAGGTCEFGGTAILVTVNPSYDGCSFIYN